MAQIKNALQTIARTSTHSPKPLLPKLINQTTEVMIESRQVDRLGTISTTINLATQFAKSVVRLPLYNDNGNSSYVVIRGGLDNQILVIEVGAWRFLNSLGCIFNMYQKASIISDNRNYNHASISLALLYLLIKKSLQTSLVRSAYRAISEVSLTHDSK